MMPTGKENDTNEEKKNNRTQELKSCDDATGEGELKGKGEGKK